MRENTMPQTGGAGTASVQTESACQPDSGRQPDPGRQPDSGLVQNEHVKELFKILNDNGKDTAGLSALISC